MAKVPISFGKRRRNQKISLLSDNKVPANFMVIAVKNAKYSRQKYQDCVWRKCRRPMAKVPTPCGKSADDIS